MKQWVVLDTNFYFGHSMWYCHSAVCDEIGVGGSWNQSLILADMLIPTGEFLTAATGCKPLT